MLLKLLPKSAHHQAYRGTIGIKYSQCCSQPCSGFRNRSFTQSYRVAQIKQQSAPPTSISLIDTLKASALPYWQLARLDKPIGTVLLFLPCTWSITMASYAHAASGYTLASNLLLFGTGALIMRGAGCTINDLWDRNLDKGVERTRDRPLARGALTTGQAVGFLGVQLAGGLCILSTMNWYSIGLGASSLLLVGVYPLMKRITHWPQFVLGLAFNWGALLGWSAVAGTVDWTVCVPLYASGVLWTLVYDTVYAHQDKRDDAVIGIKSTALLFGDNTRSILALFLLGTSLCAGAAGLVNHQGLPYFGSITAGTILLGLRLRRINFSIPQQCNVFFRQSAQYGWLIFAGALLDWMWLRYMDERPPSMADLQKFLSTYYNQVGEVKNDTK